MKSAKCTRAWEAEAVEDGRLDGVARASFERHTATCEICSREQHEWQKLGALVKRLATHSSTPLERRRLRQAILNRANRQTTIDSSSRRNRWLALATVALLVAVGIGYSFRRPSVPSPPAILSAPAFEIQPVGAAEWHVERAGARAQLRLTDGIVSLHVDKLAPGQRFTVVLPDGELEVRGTRFIVEVRDGRTDRVEVTEGAVTVKLGARESRLLGAGESWRGNLAGAEETPVDVGSKPRDNSDDPIEPATAPQPSAKPAGASPLRSANGGGPSKKEPSNVRAGKPSAGAVFVAAMAAFDAGAYGRAEQLFTEFEGLSPTDARAEDADFLRIIIRARLGDEKGARQKAHAYLARHPRAFREGEVEAFLRRGHSDADEKP
jgi:TolA-binding protein